MGWFSEGGYAPWRFEARNRWMVEAIRNAREGVLLALWSGAPGGTANCVRYARRRGVEVVNLWPVWRALARGARRPSRDAPVETGGGA